MNQFFRLLTISCIVLACILYQVYPALTTPKASTASSLVNVAQTVDFGKHFQKLGVEGSIIIYDAQSDREARHWRDRTYQHNPQRNTIAFLPASTFKILNSLISLETGVIPHELALLTWDGIERAIPEWNRDLNMKEAIRLSAVWFYQVLARRVGYDRMQAWVKKAGYGNQNIGSPEDIDTFWLTGELRITPQQQIQFLRRLYNDELPFSERSLSTVKDIMIVEQTPDYTIRGKTGWIGFGEETMPQIGWYVGYLEKGENVYFFATNIDIRNQNDAAARIELTRRCFQELALL